MSKNILSTEPEIFTINSFISDKDCQHIINISEEKLKRALVSGDKKGVVSSGRTGMNCWIPHNFDNITTEISQSISKLINVPIENAESFQIIYYDRGQEYRQHYDGWNHDYSEKSLRNMKYGGQRIWTALGYLNSVPKGGGTKFTKLNKEVSAEMGKLLVFSNVYKDTNIRHNLSEHCGMPVIKGEKYAFNLWFKEKNYTKLYSEFNPSYYLNQLVKLQTENIEVEKKEPKNSLTEENTIYSNLEILNKDFKIYNINKIPDINNIINNLISKANFIENGRRRDCWINLTDCEMLVNIITKFTNIDRNFYENINIVEYIPNVLHKRHFVAYDLTTEKGLKYTEKKGQRMYTITVVLSNDIEINYFRLKNSKTYQKGEALICKNTIENTNIRDPNLELTVINKGENIGYIANIYIREYNNNNQRIKELDKTNKNNNETGNNNNEDQNKIEEIEKENYLETFDHVLHLFENKLVKKNWKGYNSFTYLFKGDFTKFKENIIEYKKIRDRLENKSCLNISNLKKEYHLDRKLILASVNNVLDKDILSLLQVYYKQNIQLDTWTLGDRQSKRYKAHNEPMSRFLHYEILPLVEKITNCKLKPTYTYLSAYIKDAELPGHTDREDCEFTVSFIIDKPDNCSWPIYLHKFQQPEKYKGRYPENPPKDECIAVDCEKGGFMLFQGIDHIHFREKLEFEYYTIVLLHYMKIP